MTSLAVVDLLGALAYGELVSFERIASDARLAPELADNIVLAGIASTEYSHFVQVCDRLTQLGVDPNEAMAPFVAPLNQFHANMSTDNWLERVLMVYVADGIAADFYREMSTHLDEQTASLVLHILADAGQTEFAVNHIRNAILNDPKVAGRLALWGRRLMGEMISQATVVASARPELQKLFFQAAGSPDEITAFVNRLTVGHARRMDALGLAS